jgi:hypothetical protein
MFNLQTPEAVVAAAKLDACADYNESRPHQALQEQTPAESRSRKAGLL